MNLPKTGCEKLDSYCEGVKAGKIDVCRWVRLAVDRHYRDLSQQHDKNYPYYFDVGACEHYVKTFGTDFQHYEGAVAGEPIIFEPWQWFAFGSVFGWLKKKPFKGYHIRRFRKAYIIIPKKNGKALSVETDIPTPIGFRKLNNIQKGDVVFDRHGNPCNVVAVTDVMHNRPCYKIEFSDGNTIIADENHEWSTSAHIFRENKCRPETHEESIRTTKEIYNTVLVERCKKESYKYTHRNHRINKNPRVEYPEKELPIDPYVFGLWLGDGNSGTASITIGHEDLKTVDRIKDAGYDVYERKSSNENSEIFGIGRNKPNGVCNRGHDKTKYWNPNGGGKGQGKCRACDNLASRRRNAGKGIAEIKYPTTQELLSDLGVINNKHIPELYLYSSKEQRLELLKGLMDSDGYCSKAGQCEFTSTSKILATHTTELIRSLGIKATIIESDAKLNGEVISKKYRISFFAYNDMPVFKLKRKSNRQKNPPTRKTRTSYRQIVSVEKVDSVPVKCIQVDSEDNMYLCGKGFIETHNSIISGGTGLYMMDYDGWPGAQCYIMAKSVKHAKDLGYRAATSFVENNQELSKKYKINRSAADAGVYFFDNNNAFYKPITAKVEGEDGRNVHFFGPDETKDWTAPSAIYDLMVSGTINAPNSLVMGTTTAGPNEDSLGKEHQNYIEEVLQQIIDDDAAFGVIFSIDDDDKYKRDDSGEIVRDENNNPVEDEFYYERPELWAKANPNYEVSVYNSALEELLPAARKSITKRIEFKTKHLNEWHTSVSSFIKPEKWNACDLETIPPLFKGFTSIAGVSLADREKRINEIYERLFERFRGCKAWAGLDLGSVDDFTAYVMAIQNENDTLDVVPMFWIPSETMRERKNENKIWPWIDQGYIQLTPGPTTDHNFIEYCIKKTAEYVDLQHIMYDRAKADAIRNNLEDSGYDVVDHGQGYLDMNPAVDAMEKLILEKRINFGGNPVMKWMNNNTVIRMDPAGNRKFDKDKSSDKIDGMVAAAMSISQAYLQIPESRSIYDEDPEIAHT